MAITKFSNKDPVEVVLVTFDFSNLFVDGGERINSADWGVEVASGVDASPALLLEGLTSFNNTSTSRLIKAGVEGVTYHIHALVTTTKNQVLKMTGSMLIQKQGH